MTFTIDKKSRKGVITVIAAGLALACAIIFWGKGGDEAEHKEASAQSAGSEKKEEHDDEDVVKMTEAQIRGAGITTAKAMAATIGTTVELPGEVRFNDDQTAHVVPRLPGVAESVPAALGQVVQRGQQLAVIASPQLAELRSVALSTQKRRDLAKLTFEREKSLWQAKVSAEQDYLQAQQAYREAEIEAQSANAKLEALGVSGTGSLNQYVLRAPFTGTVVEKHITQGEAVKEETNVFILSDLSTVWVNVSITPQELESVRVGMPVSVRSASGSLAAQGIVSYVGSLIGEASRTATARVVLKNPEGAWRPGLYVTVALAKGQREVPVTVAANAIQSSEGKSVVYTRVAAGFRAQPVVTGISDGKQVEIVSGLSAGAVYATSGSFVLKAEQGKDSAEHGH